MKITDARKLLTDRHSRIHDASGMIYIGLSLEDAEAIASLLPIIDTTPVPEYELIPEVPEPTPEPERVVDTESGPITAAKHGPVKATQKKVSKKKKAKKGRKSR